jgi:hypothetical protein
VSISHPEVEMQPDTEIVLQVEEPGGKEPTVKVAQQGPVRTQALPAKAGSTRTVLLQAFPATYQIARANPRRRQAFLVAPNAFLVAYNDAGAQDLSTMALWPANVPLPITAAVDVYVSAPTGTVSLSILSEFWATGEGDE